MLGATHLVFLFSLCLRRFPHLQQSYGSRTCHRFSLGHVVECLGMERRAYSAVGLELPRPALLLCPPRLCISAERADIYACARTHTHTHARIHAYTRTCARTYISQQTPQRNLCVPSHSPCQHPSSSPYFSCIRQWRQPYTHIVSHIHTHTHTPFPAHSCLSPFCVTSMRDSTLC